MKLVQTLSAMALCLALAACNSGAPASAPAADAAKAPAEAAAAPAATPAPTAAPTAAAPEAAAPTTAGDAPAANAPPASGDVFKATEAQLEKGMAYVDFRKIVLAQGWQPLATAQCKENVIGGDYQRICAKNPDRCKICTDLPELNACSGDGYCLMQFKHAGASGVLKATAYGEADGWRERESGFGITEWELADKAAE
ncbi:hypothetical protein J5226_08400 [Lysobacter sp. K5869]|uniref:hypothetical protein n=1 Tax=Lysobacter sp. K5869 TaxID=2820808 RepID=UPI001C05F6AD|nr:hypothetical protein [Lysobacter sp. K5869]QWP78397.1 hypothetical protein J5226_08400 [Lysobacter sp. K5869]